MPDRPTLSTRVEYGLAQIFTGRLRTAPWQHPVKAALLFEWVGEFGHSIDIVTLFSPIEHLGFFLGRVLPKYRIYE